MTTDQTRDPRADLLDAIDSTYAYGVLGYDTPEALLAAYDATQSVPPPADRAALESVCICGHPERQHFEDACITEITGCNCGDYLEPQDAAEVIDRWRQAALQARAADRAALLREAAEQLLASDLGPRPGHTEDYGCGWSDATLRAQSYLLGLAQTADGSRVAAEEQPAETQCGCGHAADEHSVYGCIDGCGCDRMFKRPPMDPVHILGIDADPPAVAEQPDTQTREARVGRCSAVMLRVHHAPHGWEPQPGMDPVHCPGYPQPGKES